MLCCTIMLVRNVSSEIAYRIMTQQILTANENTDTLMWYNMMKQTEQHNLTRGKCYYEETNKELVDETAELIKKSSG